MVKVESKEIRDTQQYCSDTIEVLKLNSYNASKFDNS